MNDDVADIAVQRLKRKELLKMSKPKLIKLCKKNMIPVKMTNTKSYMIQQILDVQKLGASAKNITTRKRGQTTKIPNGRHTHSKSVLVNKKKQKKKNCKLKRRVGV